MEWAQIIQGLGLKYVEASADNECDPLYHCKEFMEDWTGEVKNACDMTGIRIANLYSGHGTYSTLGLAHTDRRMRLRFLEKWLKPQLARAGEFGAGLGFFTHAFTDSVLQVPAEYWRSLSALIDNLADLASYAAKNGFGPVGVEQMYTPHQVPWTISGAIEIMRRVYTRAKAPMYITIDTGHQSGQARFLRISEKQVRRLIRLGRAGCANKGVWLGPQSAFRLYEKAVTDKRAPEDWLVSKIGKEADKYPFLFASSEDGDPYTWLARLACWSPIIHLQQTDNICSAHLPFTRQWNRTGIIKGSKVLKAIRDSYRQRPEPGMPPRITDIYLTIEVFSGTSGINRDILNNLRETVAYWRRFVPEDGLTLDRLLSGNRDGRVA